MGKKVPEEDMVEEIAEALNEIAVGVRFIGTCFMFLIVGKIVKSFLG